MTSTTTLMSADELLAMPDDHQRHELVRGVLTTMALNGAQHAEIASILGHAIWDCLQHANLGGVYAGNTGFILARDPDTVRAPDLTFVRTSRLPGGRSPEGYFELAPDLAVEVLSPTDRHAEVLEKIDEYLAAGTTLVWLVQPRRERVTVYRKGRQPLELSATDNLDGEDVLPGFSLPVASLFA